MKNKLHFLDFFYQTAHIVDDAYYSYLSVMAVNFVYVANTKYAVPLSRYITVISFNITYMYCNYCCK